MSVKSRILQFQSAESGSKSGSFTEALTSSTQPGRRKSQDYSAIVPGRLDINLSSSRRNSAAAAANAAEFEKSQEELVGGGGGGMSKKTSLSINLTGGGGEGDGMSGRVRGDLNKGGGGRRYSNSGSADPKLTSPSANNNAAAASSQPEFLLTKLKSVTTNKNGTENNNSTFRSKNTLNNHSGIPAATSNSSLSKSHQLWNGGQPSNNNSNSGGSSLTKSRNNSLTSSGTLSSRTAAPSRTGSVSDIDWKDKYEESERKRLHVVTLAQKATRDYEELRRRYQDAVLEREKISQKFEGATVQLDALRKASEAAYDEYYKLKKKYDNEHQDKFEALSRVDQYNKENRRLKRQSALMMQQINDPNILKEEEEGAEDSSESDKEISYLRQRVQELQERVVELESELEKTKLTEFETQESVMLMNDTVSATQSETGRLQEQIDKLEAENRKLCDSLDAALLELENVRSRDSVDQAKLQEAREELRELRKEKNILQRQSLVFMNDDTADDRLSGALDQIKDLQTVIEEDKNNFQKQIEHLHKCLTEKENEEETTKIRWEAKIRALEDQVKSLRERAEEAERKLDERGLFEEECPASILAPPPPPPPPCLMSAPPPPPPPPLSTSLSTQLTRLKKTTTTTPEGGTGLDEGNNKQQVPGIPQIDDVVSQIKKGVKLRTVDRTMTKKQSEAPGNVAEDQAVEEMRAILNTLKRTKRLN